ncbi:hypothetical protein BDY17DRAFT_292798, partial [Neohortaea acidophila]
MTASSTSPVSRLHPSHHRTHQAWKRAATALSGRSHCTAPLILDCRPHPSTSCPSPPERARLETAEVASHSPFAALSIALSHYRGGHWFTQHEAQRKQRAKRNPEQRHAPSLKGKASRAQSRIALCHHIPGNANSARISPTSSHTMAAVATRHSNNNSPHLGGKSMTSSPRSTRNSHQPSGTSPSLAPRDPLAPVIHHPPSLHSIPSSPPMRLVVAIALRHSISHLTAPSARRSAPLISMRAVQSLC